MQVRGRTWPRRALVFCSGPVLAFVVNVPVQAESEQRWRPHLTVELKPGTSGRSAARADMFLPLKQGSDHVFFADVRAVDTEGAAFEGNLGLGYRALHDDDALPGGPWVSGAYAFYDRRKTINRKVFSQATLGAELYSEDYALRLNGYLPEQTKHTVSSRRVTTGATTPGQVTLSGTNVVTGGGTVTQLTATERALRGFDVEAGRRFSISDRNELWLYGGYFHFGRSGVPTINGPRGRLEFRHRDVLGFRGSELTLGVEAQHDDVRGEDVFGVARLRIPLGKSRRTKPLSTIERRMTEFVQRDIDVVTFAQDINAAPGSARGPSAEVVEDVPQTPVIDPSTGDQLNVYFVGGSNSGDCSQSNPCTVAQAQGDAAYGASDSLVLLDNAGAINSDVTLNAPRQQVLGGGDAGATTVTLATGDALSLSNLGARPTLAGTLTLASDSIARGFAISGSAGAGLIANGISNAAIEDVRIRNTGGAGAELAGTSGALAFSGVTIEDTAGTAFSLSGGDARISYTGSINQSGGRAVEVAAFGGTADFTGATVSSTGGSGVSVHDVTGTTVEFGRVTVTGATADAVTLTNNPAAGIKFGSLDVTTSSGRALVATNGGTVTVTSGSIDATGGAALDIDSTSMALAFQSLTSANSPTSGVRLNNAAGALTVAGATSVTNATGAGMDIIGGSAALNFANVSVNRQNAGISVDGTGGNIAFGQASIANPNNVAFPSVSIANTTGGAVSFADAAHNIDQGTGVASAIVIGNNAADVVIQGGTISSAASVATIAINNPGTGTISVGGGATATAISNSAAGGTALAVGAGSSNVSFAANTSVAQSGSGGTAVTIDGRTAGTVNVDGSVSSSGAGGRAANIGAGSALTGGTIAFGGAVTADGGGGINVQNSAAGVDFSGTVDITNAIADAVTLTGNGGAIGFADLDVATSGARALVDNAGTLTVTTGTVNTTGATGVELSGTNANVNLSSIAIDNAGAGNEGLDFDNVSGSVAVAGTTSIGSTGPVGAGIDIDGGSASYTFGIVDIANRNAEGIDIDATGGNLAFGTTTVDGAGSTSAGIDVDGTTGGTVAFTDVVNVSNSGGDGIRLANNSASVSVAGQTTVANVAGDGIDLTGSTGNVTFGAVNVNVAGADGINMQGATQTAGAYAFGDIDLAGVTATGLDMTGADATVTASSLDVDGGVTGIDLTSTQNRRSVIVTAGGTIQNITGSGVQLSNTDNIAQTANASFVFGGGQITASGAAFTVDAIGLETIDANNTGRYDFTNVTFSGTPRFASTGTANLLFVAANATGAGDGSDTTNLANIGTAQTRASTGAATTFVLVNDGNNIDVSGLAGSSFTLMDGQTIDGFGNGNTFGLLQPANVVGNFSGAATTDPTGNGAGVLTTSAGNDVVTVANNNAVANVAFLGGSNSIGGSGVNNLMVSNTAFSGAAASTFSFVNTTGTVTLANNDINQANATVLSLSGGTAGVSLSRGTGANLTGTGLSVVNTTGGSVAVTDATLAASGNTAVVLDNNAATVTLTDLTVGRTAGDTAFDIDRTTGNSSGTVTVDGTSTLDNTAGTAFAIGAGARDINAGALAITGDSTTAGSVVDIAGQSGGTITLASVTNSGSTGDGVIRTAGQTGGALNVGAVGITGFGNSGGDIAVNLAGTGGTVSFAGLDIAATNGEGLSASGIGLNEGSSSTISAIGGTAVALVGVTASDGTLAFSASSTNSSGGGIILGNIAAGNAISFDSASSVSGAGATAFRVAGGAADVTYGGTVTNASSQAIRVGDRTGGTVQFDGTINDTGAGIVLTNNNVGAPGIIFNDAVTLNTGANDALTMAGNNGATVTFAGNLDIDATSGTGLNASGGGSLDASMTANTISISSTGGQAINIDGVTANLALDDVTSGASATDGVNIDNTLGGTIVFDTVAITGATGDGINLTSNAASVSVNGGTIDGSTGDGVDSTNTALTVANLTIGGTTAVTGTGIAVVNNDATARTASITGNSVTAAANAIAVTKSGAGSLSLDLSGNTLASAAGAGANLDGAAGTGTLFVTGFNGITVTATPGGTGGLQANAVTFDADTAIAGVQQVAGGTTNIGQGAAARVQGNGLSLVAPTGDLGFTALNVFNNAGTGVNVDTKTAGTTFNLAASGGTINTTGGPALFLDPLSTSLTLASVTSSGSNTSNNTGVTLDTLTAGSTLAIGTTSATAASGTGILVQNSGGSNIDFGTTTVTAGTTAGNAVNLANNPGATVAFNNLDAATANGIGLVASNSGTVNFTGSSAVVGATGGAALSLSNTRGQDDGAAGWSFGNLSSTNSPTVGLGLANLADNVTTGNLTIDNATNAAVDIDGTGSYSFGVTNITNRNAEGIDIDGTDGTIAFGATTISGVGGTSAGIDINGTTGGTVTFSDVVNVNSSGGVGIALANNAGAVNVNGTTTVDNATGIGIDIGGTSGTIQFAATNVTNRNAEGIDIDATSSPIQFGATTVSGAGGTTAGLDITGTSGGITFTDIVNVSNSGGDGIRLANNSASVGVTGQTTVANATGDGVDLTGSTGNVSFGAVNVNVAGADGINMQGATQTAGVYAFGDVDISGVTATGLDMTGADATVTASSLDVDGGVTGIDLTSTQNRRSVIVTNGGTIQNITGSGVQLSNTNNIAQTANANFVFGGGQITASGAAFTVDAIGLQTIDANNTGRYDFTGVTFTGTPRFASSGGSNLFFVAANATGAGDGSNTTNIANIATAQTRANTGAATTFVLINDGNNIDASGLAGSSFTLMDGQTIGGFGNGNTFGLLQPANVVGNFGSVTTTDPTGNGAGVLTTSAGNNVVTVANNNAVANVSFLGGANSIGGSGLNNLMVSNTTFSGAAASTFSLANPTGTITLADNDINQANAAVLSVSGGAAGLSLSRGTGTNLRGTALSVVNTTGGSVVVTDATLAASGNTAVLLDNNAATVTLTNLSVDRVAGDTAFDIDRTAGNSTGTVTVDGTSTLDNTAGTAFAIGAGARNISAGALAITGNATTTGSVVDIAGQSGGTIALGSVTNAGSTSDSVIRTTGQTGGALTTGAVAITGFGNAAADTAVNLAGTGGTVSFTDLDITTASGNGFTASGIGLNEGTSSTIAATGGSAVNLTGVTASDGTLAFSASSTSSPGNGITLSNMAAGNTITFDNTSSISGATGTAFAVGGGAAVRTYGGTIANTAGRSVTVQSTIGGTVALTGTVNDTGTGIQVSNNNAGAASISFTNAVTLNTGVNTALTVTNNAGSAVNFTGNLDIDTTSATGLVTSGGGTVSVTGAVNSVASTAAQAVDIDGVSTNMSFASIASTGSAAQGIDLTNLLANSTFNGGVTTIGNATGQGLRIANVGPGSNIDFGTTDINNRNTTGIFIDNVAAGAVDFGATTIANPNSVGGYGIRIEDSAAAFTFASTNISGTVQTIATTDAGSDGVPDNDGDGDAIFLSNNTATTFSFTLNGGTIEDLHTDGLDIRNSRNITIRNVTIDDIDVNNTSGNVNPTNDNGIYALNLAGTNLIENSTISNFDTNGAVGDDDSAIKILNIGTSFDEIRVNNVNFTNPGTSLGGNRGFEISNRGAVNGTVVIENSTFSGLAGDGIGIGQGNSNGSGTLNVAINNTTLRNSTLAGAFGGIQMGVIGTSTLNVAIDDTELNNLYPSNANNGMLGVTAQEDGNLILKVTDSRFFNSNPGAAGASGGRAGIWLTAGNSATPSDDPDTFDITLDNNRFSNIDDEGIHIDVRGSALNGAGQQANLRITNNQIGDDGAGGLLPVGEGGFEIGVFVRARNDAKTVNLLFDGNRVRNADNSTGDETLDLDVEDNVTVNATITDNTFISQNGNQTADVDIATEDAGATLNLDLRNNSVSRNDGTSNNGIIRLNEIAGAMNVEGAGTAAVTAGNITATNTAGSAAIAGTPTFNNNANVTMPSGSLSSISNTVSQSATVSTAYTALQARLLNNQGAPASGVTVTFAAPGTGASGTFPAGNTCVTNASGVCSIAFTANATPGSFAVTSTASVSGSSVSSAFYLSNRSP